MKRSLLIILGVIALAGGLGTLISRDPGYVLVSYEGASMQTSLWVALGLLLTLVAVIYYSVRLFKFMFNSSGYYRNWRDERKSTRALTLTAKGLRYYLEGEYDRAEKFLLGGVENNSSSAINLILAAEAANKTGNEEGRESHLRLGIEQDSTMSQAAAIASAGMNAEAGLWDNCLEALSEVTLNNHRVVSLKKDALFNLGDWQGLLELLPHLKKLMTIEAYDQFEKDVVLARICEPGLSEDSARIIYKNLSKKVRADKDVVMSYCRMMKMNDDAENVLRQVIKENWQPELVELYGDLGGQLLNKRLKQAETWYKKHADDAALQLCLGKLHEQLGDRGKAREAFERSVALQSTREANIRLAGMLSFDGEYLKSNNHLKSALKLK
ncbi:MAG: heme biosynthesis HemY N-terminal domain-containing protein [Pseudomonadales bacterium]